MVAVRRRMRRRSVPNLSPAVPNPKVVLRALVSNQKSTILKLGPQAVPDIPITSAVDFILPVNCRRSTTCRSSSVGYRRQMTGKMKSTALGKNTFGTALPRRTIVTLTAFSRCVILGRWKMLSTPYPLRDRLPVPIYFWLPRMPQLENTVSLTIVRLGEAVPVVFF